MVTVEEGLLPGVKLISFPLHRDDRGFFSEVYRQSQYQALGIAQTFVQDNLSHSKKGVIRGMHFQSGEGQAKLVTVISGKIYDAFVDIRPDSPTFMKWKGVILEKGSQLLVPAGFAHGFAALEESLVFYKVSTPYDPQTEKSFSIFDPEIGIEWPVDSPLLSPRDQDAPTFSEVFQ